MRYSGRTIYGAFDLTSGQVAQLRIMDRFNREPVAKQRLKILEFANKHGDAIAADAYSITRRTIRNWRHRYEDSATYIGNGVYRYDPNSLIPMSRRPHTTRSSKISPEIVAEIRRIRYSHGCLGKKLIKPILDKYCIENGYQTISEPTIGNIIKRKEMLPVNTRFYHSPSRAKRYKRVKNRVRHSPKIDYNGYIEIDTIVRYIGVNKTYIYNALDVRNKWMYSRGYCRKTSFAAKDFLNRVINKYPYDIVTIQTDNGTEFERYFDDYLESKSIPHKYTTPRNPRVNGFIERANRTLKQEFIYEHEYLVDAKGLDVFNDRLDEYLEWYNNERPHTVLGGMPPMEWVKNN